MQLLEKLDGILKKQGMLYKEFLPILDQEEAALARNDLNGVATVLIRKDQQTRIALALEENRVATLKKIFALVAFDPRGQKITVDLFQKIFETYLENVKTYVEAPHWAQLLSWKGCLWETCAEMRAIFKQVAPRIYRNQQILKKVLHQVHLSLRLIQSESDAFFKYDQAGRSQSKGLAMPRAFRVKA